MHEAPQSDSGSNQKGRKWFKSPGRMVFLRRALVVLVILVLLGFFAAPPVLKSVLEDQLSQVLNRPLTIERIEINPLELSAKIAGLSVQQKAGGEQAGFDELYVNFSAASLFNFAVVIDEVHLKGPRVFVALLEAGKYDVSDLLDVWLKPSDAPSEIPRFSVNNIRVEAGRLQFDDRPRGELHRVEGLELAVPFISSLPYQAEIRVQPMFRANVNGALLNLEGQTTPFDTRHESSLSLALNDFDLSQFQAYLPAGFPLRIDNARLNSSLRAVFRQLERDVFSFVVVGGVQLDDVQLAESGGQPLLAWKKLDIDLTAADLINRNVSVRRVALDGADVHLSVDRRGHLNVERIADALTGPSSTPAASVSGGASKLPLESIPEAKPWVWSVAGIAINNATVHWDDVSNAQPVRGMIRELSLESGAIDSQMNAPLRLESLGLQLDFGDFLQVDRIQIRGLVADLSSQRLDIAELNPSGVRIALARAPDGALAWLTAPRTKPIRTAIEKNTSKRDWQAEVASLNLADAAIRFEDRSVSPAVVQTVEAIQMRAERLGNVLGVPARLNLNAQVNATGKLAVDGQVQLFPLVTTLNLKTQAIPLTGLQGYANQFLNVGFQRGLLSNDGALSLRMDKNPGQDGLKLSYRGSATLGNLLAVDTESKADFLRWKSLHFGGIDFRLDPMKIDIREIALTDFFSRLVLEADGHLNLADIVRRPADSAVEASTKVEAPGTVQGEALVRQATPDTASVAVSSDPVPITIGKITLNNGRIDFSDYFIKPNYSVSVGKLGGRVTGLSSVKGTVADLELRGTYAGYAPVEIAAKLNPLAAESFLDLQAGIRGVDMTGFSPYSGKYAGYAIDKGKLSLNVAYTLENRQLRADNRLFIDQFTFGERVESPDATKLPVNLAIALLKNNRGEIDINLPISGSLDDPEFSVGGLVVRVIVNLFVKAVTSPFALLGSMFGGGEELSNVGFVAGRADIDAVAAKRLETLARALNDRSALKLEVAGRVAPELDRDGLRRAAIERAMQIEKRGDLQKKGLAPESLAEIRIDATEYPVYLSRVYKAAKFPKPRNVVGLPKTLPVDEMEKLLLTHLPATDEDLSALARQRAEAVQLWLVEVGKVSPERIFLVQPKAGAEAGSQVDFSLR